MPIASGAGQETLSDAWRRAGIGRTEGKSKRVQAWALYEKSNGPEQAGPGLDTAASKTDARHKEMTRCEAEKGGVNLHLPPHCALVERHGHLLDLHWSEALMVGACRTTMPRFCGALFFCASPRGKS